MNTAFIREVGLLQFIRRKFVRQYYKRILKRDHAMLLPTGEWMNLPISDRFATEAFITNGNVDWGSEALLFSLLTGSGAFLDVGSHIGYYALYMLPRAAEVYAFEPDPKVRVLLEQNVKGKSKIQVLPWAVGATPGRARFTLEADSAVSHFAGEYDNPASIITVDVITLDNFANTRGTTVEAIKIDVEGHDTAVIQGALNLMYQQQPIVLTEAQPDATLFALTRKVNYRVFAFVAHPKTRHRHLAELLPDHPIPGETKMLFLVPPRLSNAFTPTR